jgi:hypothetical protein
MDSHDMESLNLENLESRPLKKAKFEQMDDCNLSPSPPPSNVDDLEPATLMKTKSEQMNDLDLSPPSPSLLNLETSRDFDYLEAHTLMKLKSEQMCDLDLLSSPLLPSALTTSSPVSVFVV